MKTSRSVLALVCICLGVIAGLGMFTFSYAEGTSYFSDDPSACVNCHIMKPQFDGWAKGSHHAVAVCNDCHTPDAFFEKYWVKSVNGYRHSAAFTTGNFHEPIAITPFNREVTERSCRECHADLVHRIDWNSGPGGRLDCIRCHSEVGH